MQAPGTARPGSRAGAAGGGVGKLQHGLFVVWKIKACKWLITSFCLQLQCYTVDAAVGDTRAHTHLFIRELSHKTQTSCCVENKSS